MSPTATKRNGFRSYRVRIPSGTDAHRAELRLILDNPRWRRELFPASDRLRPPKQSSACEDAIFELTQKHLANTPLWWKDMEADGLVERDGARGWKRTSRWKSLSFDHQVPTYCHIKQMKRGYRNAIQAGYREEWTSWEDVKKGSKAIHEKMYKLSPLFFSIRHLYQLTKAESDPKLAKIQSRSHHLPAPFSIRSRPTFSTRSAAIPSRALSPSESILSDAESDWSDVDDDTSSEAEVPPQRRQSDRIRLSTTSKAIARACGRRTRASGMETGRGGMGARPSRKREWRAEVVEPEWESDSEEGELEEDEGDSDEESQPAKRDQISGRGGGSAGARRVTTRSGRKRSARAVAETSEVESEADASPQPTKRPRRASSGGRLRSRVGPIDRNMEEIVEQLELQEKEAARMRAGATRRVPRTRTGRDSPHAWVVRGRVLSSPEAEVKAEEGGLESEELVVAGLQIKRPRPHSSYGAPSLRVDEPAGKEGGEIGSRLKSQVAEVRPQPAKKPRVLPKIAKYPQPFPSSSTPSATPPLTRSERDSSGGTNSPLTPPPLPLTDLPDTSVASQLPPRTTGFPITATKSTTKSSSFIHRIPHGRHAESISATVRQITAAPTAIGPHLEPKGLSSTHLVSSSTPPAACASCPSARPVSGQNNFGIQALDWNDPMNNDAFLDALYTNIYTRCTLIPIRHPLPTSVPMREPAKVERDLYAKLMMLEPGHVWLRQANMAGWAGWPKTGRNSGQWKAAAGWPLTGIEYGFQERLKVLSDSWLRGTFELDHAGHFTTSLEVPTVADKMTFLFGPPGPQFSPSPPPFPELPPPLPPVSAGLPHDLFSPSPSPSSRRIPLPPLPARHPRPSSTVTTPPIAESQAEVYSNALARYVA